MRSGALLLSGLRSLAGKPLSAEEALLSLGVSVGEVLTGVDPSFDAERAERIARAEPRWLRELTRLDSVELPYLRPERMVAGSGSRGRRTLALPNMDALAGGEATRRADAVLAAVALYLARISPQEQFDLGLLDADLLSEAEGAQELFSREVPWRIALAEDAEHSARDASASLLKSLSRYRKRGPFLNDMVQRYRALRSSGARLEQGLSPVLLARVNDLAGFAAPPSSLLSFATDVDGTELLVEHDEQALAPADADRILAQLACWLEELARAPEQAFRRISLLTEEERLRIAQDWNATAKELPAKSTIVQQFDAQVARSPEADALVCEGRSYTYLELSRRANQLANYLKSEGVGPDVMVGIFVERSLDMMVSVLAVLKAGGAYVPLDPSYPRSRIAFMIADSQVPIVLTQKALASEVPESAARTVAVDSEWPRIAEFPNESPSDGPAPENLAYVIYTSGSTGKPKGVMVEHRNVVNFFAGMDECIPHDPPGTWLAVTSLSFDISVLELHWTLCRGFKVVLYVDRKQEGKERLTRAAGPAKPIDFGIFLWGNDDSSAQGKYDLMLESARFADERGFKFVSTPERHFHAFGGPFPNPSVTGAALAAVTKRVEIRAGSCVLPLHQPIRVAEEWSVVDNLSGGRVGLAFASGWQPKDFVIRPQGFKDAKRQMFESIETVRKLWRGESVLFDNPFGDMVEIRVLPHPVQPELPVWVTSAGNVETYEMAGRAGANLLTHLLGQSLEETAGKIRAYREARREAGFDPASGKVTLMLHSCVGESDEEVRELVRQPMKDYLSSSISLIKGFAWSFPAFKRPEGTSEHDDVSLDHLSEEEMDALLDHAFERYYETSGLFGTPQSCVEMVERVRAVGVDEIACLVDFGMSVEDVRRGLPGLATVMEEANRTPGSEALQQGEFGLAALVAEHGVTHFQCTPSMAKMMTLHDDMRAALGSIEHIMIGGEAFPVALAHALDDIATGTVTNMYGPTETTIWSSTQRVSGKPQSISVGRPIANTQLYIVDRFLEPVPPGLPGELLIGGDGVVRGYHQRPELTAERFVSLPSAGERGSRVYRTGDLARFAPDGSVDFLGRMDFQVKIRGYRIELGEIEAKLSAQAAVRECVVVAQPDPSGDPRLVAYLVAEGSSIDEDALRAALRKELPEFMLPSVFASLPAFPLTPNGKIDRKALPPPESLRKGRRAAAAPVAPSNALERTIAEIWERTLQLRGIGRDENFFDIGGHSLLMVQAHRALRERLEQPVKLTDLYRFPTIGSLAEALSGDDAGEVLDKAVSRGARRRQALGRRKKKSA
jgi:natural product biosynthesis luciferase-like monooxygenase protein